MSLTVREMAKEELSLVVDYFINADEDFLHGMGATKRKLPNREEWLGKIESEFEKPYDEKEYYYLIWLDCGRPVGHSNVNFIEFGKRAKIHIHLWHNSMRKKGMGETFVKKSIPVYFEKLNLQILVCEPYALNPAPNRILPRLGFEFVKEYETVPGIINFKQPVRRYILTERHFKEGVEH